jgi:uncharacterized membrane protein YccC
MHDPGLQSLRRAARVAIVVPLVFAFFLNVLDDSVAALFAGFGSFALLGFADFGGPPRQRAAAYLILTAVGGVLVVVGTLVCNQPVLAALLGVVVATAVRFAGCFGGYFAASVSPLILAYVLGASVAAPVDEIPDRLLGWVVAGLLATVAALVLWPRRQRMLIREAAAAAADALAAAVDTLSAPAGPSPEVLATADAAVTKLVAAASVPRRPAGPSAHDAALAFLVDQLERIGLLVRTAQSRPTPPPAARDLGVVASRALRAIAGMLGTAEVPADLDDLVEACIASKHVVVSHAVEELGDGAAPGAVLDEIDSLVTERLALLLCASALANASVIVSGHGPADETITIPLETPAMAGGSWNRFRALVAANAVPTSAWAQESLRAGIAVGAALLIAGELKLDHGFWVVLGTLSVLRSNAFETGRTALMAAAGTAVGFAVSAGLLAVVGFDHTGLWVIVVLGFFLSAYTPQVVGFVVGQMCFTIAVVAMFNLIIPQGWHTGLVRFENIVIGSAVSAIVALLFWPRRASVGLRANLIGLYQDLSRALQAGPADPDAVDPVHRAELRAHASYVQYLSETARDPKGRRPWAALIADAAQVRFAFATLQRHRKLVRFDRCGPTRGALHACATEIAGALDDTATLLGRGGQPPHEPVDVSSVAVATREPICACLEHHAHEAGPEGPLEAGLDAALVRDLLLEVAVIADDAMTVAPTVPKG